MHVYEVRPRKDHRGVDLISDAMPFGRLWYDTPDNAVGYAMHSSRSQNAVIRVYDEAGNVTDTHEHGGDFKECHQQRNRLRAIYFAFLVWDSCVFAIPPSPRLRHAQAKEEEAETL